MKDSRKLVISYQGFKRTEPHTFLLAPYCLKVFKQRWYLVGKPEDHPEEKEPRVYALDRVKDMAVTDKPFHLPAAFKAATFFENQFGIDRSKTKAEKIRVKVANWDANFLLSLPLHTSQRVVESNDEYTGSSNINWHLRTISLWSYASTVPKWKCWLLNRCERSSRKKRNIWHKCTHDIIVHILILFRKNDYFIFYVLRTCSVFYPMYLCRRNDCKEIHDVCTR